MDWTNNPTLIVCRDCGKVGLPNDEERQVIEEDILMGQEVIIAGYGVEILPGSPVTYRCLDCYIEAYKDLDDYSCGCHCDC